MNSHLIKTYLQLILVYVKCWFDSYDYQNNQYEKVEEEYPLSEDMTGFYQHLEQTLLQTGFIIDAHPGQVMMKLKRLFNRARVERQELNILRGILSSVQSQSKKQP